MYGQKCDLLGELPPKKSYARSVVWCNMILILLENSSESTVRGCIRYTVQHVTGIFRDHFMYVPSQWETTLQCYAVSQVCISSMDNQLHQQNTLGCNYLPLSEIPTSGAKVLKYRLGHRIKPHTYIKHMEID